MAFSPFDPVDEERSLNDLEKNKQSVEQLKATVNKDVADRVSKIYRDNPYIPASVVLAMAKNGMSDEAIQAVQKSAALTTAKQLNPNKPKKQSWFERNVYGNFKAATRWGFAALQLAPDLVQNVAAEAFSPNDPEGMDGWFKSTNLGSLMANSDQAGTGFFVGGEVAKNQAERAREFRGTINGHAWTVGRGAASLVFTPGSVPYNVLSGFADAAVQFVDPTIVGGKVAAGVRAGRAAVPVLAGAEAIAGAKKLAVVGETGLEAAESIAFNASKFGQWVTTNKGALRLTDNIVSVAKSADTRPAKIQKVLELFDYSVSPDVAAAFADADDVVKVRGILGDASARLSGSPDDVLIPRDVRQIPGAKGAYGVSKYAIFDKAREKVPLYRNIRNSRYLAEVPKQNVIINGSGLDKTQAIKSFSDYFQGIGVGKDTAEYRSIMDKVVTSFTAGGDPGASRAAIQTAYDDALQLIFEKAGLQKESKEAIRAAIQRAKDELAKSRVFNLNELGEVDDGGFIKMIWEDLPGVVKEKFTPDQWDRLVLTGPGALAQLADDLLILPDFRQMRRLSGSMNFATTIQKGVRAGEARGPLVLAEFIQNEIWKPITLATGGYIMRNMIDAQTRIAMTGLSGFFNHPRDYIMWVLKKKGFADIRGEEFDRVIKSTAAEWDVESNKFVEAMDFDVNRNLEDTRLARSRNLKNNNFAIVDSIADPKAHTIGYVDNMGQIFGDQINQFLAKLQAMGLPEAERQRIVKDWLMSPEGAEARKTATRYLQNGVKVTDPETGFQSIIPIDIADDNVVAAWVDKLSTSKINTIVRGDRDLAVVAGYNKVPVMFTDGAGNTRVVATTDQFFDDIDPDDILAGSGDAGTIIRLADGNEGLVLSRQADETGRAVVTVQPVYPKEAFPADRLGSSQLRRLIDSKRQQGKLAQKVMKAERGVPVDGDVGRKALEAKDFFVDKFFNGLYGTLTRNLEKSPLFRQAYYREVGLTAEALAPDQARQLLDNINRFAAQLNTTPAKYVGDKKILDKLEEVSRMAFGETEKLNPALASQEPGFLFHGTAKPLPNGVFDDPFEIDVRDIDNLFGRGIYLTNNPKVATSYTSKGAKRVSKKVDGISVSPQGSVYKVKLADDVNLLDLRVPSPQFNEIIRKQISSEWVQNAIDEANNDLDDLLKVLDNPAATGEQVMAAFKEVLTGTRKSLADELSFDISYDISEIADGLRYQGGVRRGGLGEHDAYVILNKNKLVVEEGISPTAMVSSGPTGTIDDLDGYAKAVALRFVKDTLYNATSRNNLEDILRVVIPFGGAWKEVLGTYASAALEDPSRIRRAQLVFDGARKFDPDGNGEGFFYRDATTGEYSFNFPASGWITELLTGTEAPLQAPVKRVSIGLGVVPAIGPMAQIAYSKLAPDTPSLDAITKVLLPYGRKEGLGLTPLWVQRMTQAFEGNTLNLETVFGNTYIETLRAVSTSGEYDLKDPNEQERLYADVRQKARVLTALRALGQFFGPTSPAPEFKIETEAGDMYASQLVKEFQKLQAENYDTAVSRFLETYGNDAILYISNKTESLVGGLEATEEFGDWERGPGKNLLRRYPDVAAFMAPGGYDFSFEVWQRQIRGGKRRRLTDQEMIDLAQYRAASAQYRTLREKLPPNPSDEQKAWLRQWRIQLNKEYPGFPAVAEFNPGEFPGKIAQMKRMVQDEALADNDVAQALKQYLDARDKAVGNYVQAGGAESGFATALRAAPLRDWLANIGRVLKEQTPEFARIYDRILANEVDA